MTHDIMFYYFITPVHAGSGQSRGFIDRSIQRNAITGYPIIQWRSIKGSLRAMMVFPKKSERSEDTGFTYSGLNDEYTKKIVFGHEETNAGPLLIGDANLLFFPAPSLKGLFLYVTSPSILKSYADLAQEELFDGSMLPELGQSEYICSDTVMGKYSIDKNIFIGPTVTLSSYQENKKILNTINESIIPRLDKKTQEALKDRIVIVNDEVLRHITLKSNEVRPNIKIDPNGITTDGSLRFTEYLPERSIMFSRIDTDYIDDSKQITDKAGNTFQWETPEDILTGFKETITHNQVNKTFFRFGGEDGGCMGKCRLMFKQPDSQGEK